jgi:hypothetical protein
MRISAGHLATYRRPASRPSATMTSKDAPSYWPRYHSCCAVNCWRTNASFCASSQSTVASSSWRVLA